MEERRVGTISRGIRCPIIREGDDLVRIVTDSVLAAAKSDGFSLRDRDVIAITESIVARAQGNYCTVDDIAADVKAKTGGETVGVIFPILSRNRFAIVLRGKGLHPGRHPLRIRQTAVDEGDMDGGQAVHTGGFGRAVERKELYLL